MQNQSELIKEVIKIEWWQQGLFEPYRYKIIYGGRGSGKSYAVADALIIESLHKKHLVLCGREFQNSIKDSVHSLLQQRIEALGFTDYFEVTRDEINCTYSDSRFIFKGLRHNIDSIKSMAGITRLWIEEADTLSAESWRIIEPTIREPESEIWCTLNPKNKTDVLYKTFIASEQPNNAYVVKVNYSDNPYFPDVLREQMEALKIKYHGMYRHIWLGECLEHSDAQVFKGYWTIAEFEEPAKVHKYFGLDFGFRVSKTAGIRCYMHENKIYITHEAVKLELDIDDTGKFLEERLPDLKKYTIYADCASPILINALKKERYKVEAVKKGKDSIEGGIKHIKSFDQVIIHPRCVETIKEFTLYSHKVDERSGDITDDIIDKHNDCIDALRYALERCTRRTRPNYANIKFEQFGL
jgi:phage terminase large subunit